MAKLISRATILLLALTALSSQGLANQLSPQLQFVSQIHIGIIASSSPDLIDDSRFPKITELLATTLRDRLLRNDRPIAIIEHAETLEQWKFDENYAQSLIIAIYVTMDDSLHLFLNEDTVSVGIGVDIIRIIGQSDVLRTDTNTMRSFRHITKSRIGFAMQSMLINKSALKENLTFHNQILRQLETSAIQEYIFSK